MNKRIIKMLEKAIDKYGLVHIAYHLGHRDTWRLKKWMSLKEIPERWKDDVMHFLNHH